MRKQILALLSALGLAGSVGSTPAQDSPEGGKVDHTVKAESTQKTTKAAQERNAVRRAQTHKKSKANTDGTSNTVKTPPGVHTLNPQPLPPGVHTLNPQPLPPGVHTSDATKTSTGQKSAGPTGKQTKQKTTEKPK